MSLDPEKFKVQFGFLVEEGHEINPQNGAVIRSLSERELTTSLVMEVILPSDGIVFEEEIKDFLSKVLFYFDAGKRRDKTRAFKGTPTYPNGKQEIISSGLPFQKFLVTFNPFQGHIRNPSLARKLNVPLVRIGNDYITRRSGEQADVIKPIFENENPPTMIIRAIFQITNDGTRTWKVFPK